MSAYTVLPVTGIGEVALGDDIALLVQQHAPPLADGDVVVVTSKIVSKSEGRTALATDREAAIETETARVVATRGQTSIRATHGGLVLAAAGVDASNVPDDVLLLLPADPDASARRIRVALQAATGRRLGVVITDTMGRPWRTGLIDVAIGAAGVAPVEDFRGSRDPQGRELAVTVTAVADEIASAAELASGKLGRVPVTIVRGLDGLVTADDGPGARALIRGPAEDMFLTGHREAASLGAAAALTALGVEPSSPEYAAARAAAADAVERHVASTSRRGDPGTPDR